MYNRTDNRTAVKLQSILMDLGLSGGEKWKRISWEENYIAVH